MIYSVLNLEYIYCYVMNLLSLSSVRVKWPLALYFLTLCMSVGSVYATDESYSNKLGFRGINIALKAIPTRATASEFELDKFVKWGVNLIRLGIRTDMNSRGYGNFYSADGQEFNESGFIKLDKFLDLAADRKLRVIIATPAFPGARNGEIWESYDNWDKLEDLWSFIAKRYIGHPAVLGYHPIDEANVVSMHGNVDDRVQMRIGAWEFPTSWKNTPKDYFSLVENIGQVINSIDPSKIVVISGVGRGGKAINYNWMRKVNVKNAVYAFNFYFPSDFANSGKKGRPIVPYSRDKDLHKTLQEMKPVQLFAKNNDVRIMVTGFGLPYHTEGIGAKLWMEDVISFFEVNDWLWTYFSYSAILRSPDLIRTPNGKLQRNENTERLSILKKYWSGNSKQSFSSIIE